jgi:hypothetical protein
VVMDEPHLLAAGRYIALNPVVAGLVGRAEDWPWSSTRAQLAGEDDELATVAPLRALIPILRRFWLCRPTRRRRHGSSGPPPSAARLGGRNGSRCSAPARPPFGTPQTRPKAREWSGTPRGKRSCCET